MGVIEQEAHLMYARPYLKSALASVMLVLALALPVWAQPAQEQAYLFTIGVLSAQGAVLTYTSIGAVADGYASHAYNKSQALTLLETFVETSRRVKESLNALVTANLVAGPDIQYINILSTAYNHLMAEATALQRFIRTGDQAHVEVYETNRQQASNAIAQMLKLASDAARQLEAPPQAALNNLR